MGEQRSPIRTAVIVDAVRTPGGKRGGRLQGWHPVDLAAHVLRALVNRNDLDPALVEDVIVGCVTQTGEQSLNVARNAVLAAGFPEQIPGVTIDRQCGSSQQAAHFAAQAVMAGVSDVVIAGGVESMSRVPLGATIEQGPGLPFGPAMVRRYHDGLVPQGVAAELVAQRWGISRQEVDQLAYESHVRAAAATEEGRFGNEVVPVEVEKPGRVVELVTVDEGIQPEVSLEALAGLHPTFKEDGIVTAGNSAQLADCAAAVLVMSEEKAAEVGCVARARFVAFSVVGVDPVAMLTGPIPATAEVLTHAGLELDDIDRFEVNEAFGSVLAAWLHETGADYTKVNVNGGAMALGHPLGATGARLMATLVHELERSGGRYGLQVMCEGGGMANATILERLG